MPLAQPHPRLISPPRLWSPADEGVRAVTAVDGDSPARQNPAPVPGNGPGAPALLLHDLLAAAGSVADELLRQLHADLRQAGQALRLAVRGANAGEVRAQSHVLIALAGTVGDADLHRQCKALNALAHQPLPQPAALATLAAQVLAGLDRLIAQTDRLLAMQGGAP